MVFDWFQRSSIPQGQPGGQPEPESGPPSAPETGDAAAPEAAAAQGLSQPASPPPAPASADPTPSPTPESDAAPVQPTSPAPMAGVDGEALEWARQAYARLKAQQEASRQQAQAPAPVQPPAAEPAPQDPAAPGPPAAEAIAPAPESPAPVASPPADEPAPAPEPSAATRPPEIPSSGQAWQAAVQAPLSQSVAPEQAEPTGPSEQPGQPLADAQAGALTPLPESGEHEPTQVEPEAGSPGAPPGLSLLEQAAAQRAERQRELLALALEEPPSQPAPGAGPTPAATPEPGVWSATIAGSAPVAAPVPATPLPGGDAEPQLGAFDADFTWSAEVLAAQGRRADQVSLEEIDWLGRLRRGLEKTRRNFVTQLLTNLGDDPLTPEVLDELETLLLRADVGVKATDQALGALRERLNVEVVDPSEGIRFLKDQLKELLEAPIRASGSALLAPQRDRLNVWLLVGVNGVGKTTTLGKLANLAIRSGYSCLIAAADTFRAAAVEQVRVWGERSGVTVVSNPSANADPAAVVFDAIGAAQSKGLDLVLVDTAGRLQTKHNLMEELAKVRRIVDRLAPEAAVESLLVLDASQGQNGLRQAMAFAKAAGLTGVVLTKLDGSARGGVALAVASEAGLPIRFIGAGEGIRDLRPFNSFEFVEALLDA